MRTTEHLVLIVAFCRRNIALAEKRTPGKWTYDGVAVKMPGGVGCVAMMATDCGDYILEPDAAFIAACAGAAEAGWRATIATVELLNKITMLSAANYDQLSAAIITSYPLDLIQ